MVLSEKQIEAAARWFCVQTGSDPQQQVADRNDTRPDGIMLLNLVYSPLWKCVAREIRKADLIHEAIQYGYETPRE